MKYFLSYIFFQLFLLNNFSNAKNFSSNVFQTDSLADTIFDNKEFIIVDSINIRGNKKTKNYIIERELTFAVGDTLFKNEFAEAIERSKKNIFNTSLFLDVYIDFDVSHSAKNVCTITVSERWYVFPKLYFDIVDRNFNVWWVEQDHQLSRTEYGLDLIWYNFTGNRDNLGIKAILGYTQKFELSYNRPHLFNHSDFGGGFSVLYANNKQLAFTTEDNKHLFYRDSSYVRERFSASVHLTKRSSLYNNNLLKLKYHHNWIADTVSLVNPDYFLNGTNEQEFLSLSYTFASNHVDDKAYPLEGYYAELQAAKIGLGIFDKLNQLYLSAQYNQYWKLTNKIFLQGQLAGQFIFGATYPYINLISLGYCENYVRGYEYYVIDGEQTYLMRTNLKFQLFDWHFNAPIINWKVFENIPVKGYLKIFSDAGYVADKFYAEYNFLTNTMQYSAGVGLDVTTYYDWVFRFEYAVNALGEFGLFLHIGLDLNTYEDCNIW
ncbi:MAG: BamA/TamA family outer membrane protein [Fimbriimonadaceae bacterium]|nr:BamA/TamA family outer membrane protein [Chitinophagales bacterium]